MADRIQLKRDTAANWTTHNPVLSDGQQGYETDTRRLKIGNGIDSWNLLPYFNLFWARSGTDVIPFTDDDNVSFGSGGLKDVFVTIAIRLGDALNTALSTVNKTIIGAINELFITKQDVLSAGTGLTKTGTSIANNLSTGVSGGQSVVGGIVAGEDLRLKGNSFNSTSGSVIIDEELDATNTTTAGFIVSSGMGVAKKSFFGGVAQFNESVGIGGAPVAAASLDIQSTLPLLIPRLNTASVPIDNRIEGMVAYDTATNQLAYYDGTTWVKL